MRGNIKIRVSLVIIALATMFMVVATASAGPEDSPLLRGKYSFTGSGNCVASTTGFDDSFNPNPGASVFGLMQIWEGEYTFDGKGSGSIKATVRGLGLPPANYNISISGVSFPFKYEMTDHNRFQTYLPDEPGYYDTAEDLSGILPTNHFNIVGKCDGAAERDGASIKLTCGPPQKHIFCFPNPDTGLCDNLVDFGLTPLEVFCSFSHVGLRVPQ